MATGLQHIVLTYSVDSDPPPYGGASDLSKIKRPPKAHYVKARESRMVWEEHDVEKVDRKDMFEDDQVTLVNGVYVLHLSPKHIGTRRT